MILAVSHALLPLPGHLPDPASANQPLAPRRSRRILVSRSVEPTIDYSVSLFFCFGFESFFSLTLASLPLTRILARVDRLLSVLLFFIGRALLFGLSLPVSCVLSFSCSMDQSHGFVVSLSLSWKSDTKRSRAPFLRCASPS